MKLFLNKPTLLRKNYLILLLSFFILLLLPLLSGCRQTLDYFDYVSELRGNLFLAENEDFSLRVYAVVKETPYATDGIPQETSPRFEAYLVAPTGSEQAELHFSVGERTFGGEMSYDNVKGEYFYSCTLDVSALKEIECTVKHGEKEMELTASSVLQKNTLSPRATLEKLTSERAELFASLTDKYGFAGEIYLRLIYEDTPYYYVGVIDRTGKIHAFLMNAQSGKILAHRES